MIKHPDDWEDNPPRPASMCMGCGALHGRHRTNCWAQQALRAAEAARKEREAKKEAAK